MSRHRAAARPPPRSPCPPANQFSSQDSRKVASGFTASPGRTMLHAAAQGRRSGSGTRWSRWRRRRRRAPPQAGGYLVAGMGRDKPAAVISGPLATQRRLGGPGPLHRLLYTAVMRSVAVFWATTACCRGNERAIGAAEASLGKWRASSAPHASGRRAGAFVASNQRAPVLFNL